MRFYISLLLPLIISCQNDNAIISQPIFTDSCRLEQTGVLLKFNSFGVFDTSYHSLHGIPCLSPTYAYTFANSKYSCIDTFGFMHPVFPEATMLYLDISESELDEHKTINLEFVLKEKDKYEAGLYATKSYTEPIVEEVKMINGIPFCYVGYERHKSDLFYETTLKAFTILENKKIDFTFYCHAKNCEGKLKEFEKILCSVVFVK